MLRFQQPCNVQASSILLQIPVEVRAKTLRCLLKDSDPIISRIVYRNKPGTKYPFAPGSLQEIQYPCRFPDCVDKDGRQKYFQRPEHRKRHETTVHNDSDKDYEAYLSFSAALLRSCQALYTEARHILYEENTLAIRCAPSDKGQTFDILTSRLSIELSLTFIAGGISLQSIRAQEISFITQPERSRLDSTRPQEISQWDHRNWEAAARFQKYEVSLQLAHEHHIWMACRVLSKILWQKRVVMNIVPPVRSPRRGDLTRACRQLRCRSIEFVQLHESSQGDADTLERTRRIIEDDNNIDDNLRVLWQRFERFTRKMWCSGSTGFDSPDLKPLTSAVHLNDIELFEKARSEVLSTLPHSLASWKSRELSLARKKREEADNIEANAAEKVARLHEQLAVAIVEFGMVDV